MRQNIISWRWLVIAAAVLLLFVYEGSAAPQPTKSPTKSTAKPTSKTTKTSTTSTKPTTPTTTKTSKTKSSKTTKSSTSKETTYTWKAVSSKPNCPTYAPTQGFATRTFSAQNSVATSFVNLNGGTILKQLGYNDDTGNTVILKTLNDSQIQVIKPNHYLMIVDNDGILVYDDKCKKGARLRIPNFFNLPSGSNSSSLAERSTEEPGSLAVELVPRAKQPDIDVTFRFVDQCGYKMAEQVVSGSAAFKSQTLPDIPEDPYLDSYESGRLWDATTSNPINVDTADCRSGVDAIGTYFLQGLIAGVVENTTLFSAGTLLGRKVAGESNFTSLFTAIGISKVVSVLDYAVNATAAIQYAFGFLNMKYLLCTSLQQEFRFELNVTTQRFGSIDLNRQTSPFHSVPSQVVVLPTKVQDPCPTTYPTSEAFADTCQEPEKRLSPDPFAAGCPQSLQDYDPFRRCGANSVQQCECGFNVHGEPICRGNTDFMLCGSYKSCTSNADCSCLEECIPATNPCGFSLCYDTADCRHATTQETYEQYGYY